MKIIKFIRAHFQDIELIYILLIVPLVIAIVIRPSLINSSVFETIGGIWVVGYLLIMILTYNQNFALDTKIEARYQRSAISWLQKMGEKINKWRKK